MQTVLETRAPLTPRQLEVYRAIRGFCQEKGHPPTLEEISGVVGVSSPSTTWKHVDAIRRKGWLVQRTSGFNTPRNIWPTDLDAVGGEKQVPDLALVPQLREMRAELEQLKDENAQLRREIVALEDLNARLGEARS